MSPFFHVSYICLHASMSPSLCLHVSGILQTETELTENGNFRLFAANGKRKQQTSISLLQMETENGSLFSLVCKR
jgi:hypothetical protein